MDSRSVPHQFANGVLRLSADVVAAFVARNVVPATEVAGVVASVFDAFSKLSHPEPLSTSPKPAVAVSRSVQSDHLVCLEDGKKLKMLKRYLQTQYGLSPDEYRRRWRLPPDYPMVAPAYAKRRSDYAKQIGLGRRVRSLPP